jgi:hypothetical protein
MGILWCGGEDIDVVSTLGLLPTLTAATFRAGYARLSLDGRSPIATFGNMKSWPGGAVTALWFSVQHYSNSAGGNPERLIGIGNSADCATGKGLWICISAASDSRYALYKFDGTTMTLLAAEAGNSNGASMQKLDLNLVSFGANNRIVLYCNGVSIIDVTADLTISGISDFDCVVLSRNTQAQYWSEFIVADEDTRTLSLCTHYPSGAGSLLEWTGAYTTIDETTLSDADLTYFNTTAKKAQFALSDTPAGQFAVLAANISARACKSSGSAVSNLRLGVLSGGTEDKDAGQAVTTAWVTKQRLVSTINGAQITTAILDAMELHLETLT